MKKIIVGNISRRFKNYIVNILLAIFFGLFISISSSAEDYFNPALLAIDSASGEFTDLSLFEQGAQSPGVYRVDVFVNGVKKERRDILFVSDTKKLDKTGLMPNLTVEDLKRYGVRVELYPELMQNTESFHWNLISHSKYNFQFNNQELDLSFPQAVMNSTPRGYVSPEQWDQGITAFRLNYDFSGSNNFNKTGSNNSNYFLSLQPGLNIGPWRLRHYGSMSYSRSGYGDSKPEWHSVYGYAERSIVPWKSGLKIGDTYTDSSVFDGVAIRGASLASDNAMLPDSMRGYAPIVRGVANTNAQIIIRQNGFIIYQKDVTPGAFEISDLNASAGNGDLHVTIKESDGHERYMIVPFANLAVLQREGQLNYNLSAGKYRGDSDYNQKIVLQHSGAYGLPAGYTLYWGNQLAKPYKSSAIGLGSNLGDFGALSVDVTQARATLIDQPESKGHSWRFRYNKNMNQTGTNIAVAGYRYSTHSFYTLQETLDSYRTEMPVQSNERRKERFEVQLGQALGGRLGSISLGLLKENFWNTNRSRQSYQLGYGTSWKGISFNLNYSHNKNTNPDLINQKSLDDMISLNLSMPLTIGSTYVSYGLNNATQNGTTHSVNLSGSALDDNSLSWGIQSGYNDQNKQSSSSASLNWRAAYGELNLGLAAGQAGPRLSYGARGGMLLHQKGVTLGQLMGETVALVEAKGAAGVAVKNKLAVKTDWRGYAIVPEGAPYRSEPLHLDTEMLADNVEIELTTQTVVPTRGAIALAKYKTKIGRRVLMNIEQHDGQYVPFGAIVRLSGEDGNGSMVGDYGQVYLTGVADDGTLQVRWGNQANQSCVIDYQLPANASFNGITEFAARCKSI
ncbi:fimbria/pilus outer membrane usher protein [Aeromonas salmonicida]|uniref:fimbria/pilus outer membrane usher protein n=1 Tax=Aeromonas salmonicida TaxID=645 RepID=UPI00279654C5|nr:fimbria/pilus outer membrane usher protein [Aeromonas salmonicida]MDQ1884170.1 fimbria/pilus outer membrane usher protein [Aeromonas salmonicida]